MTLGQACLPGLPTRRSRLLSCRLHILISGNDPYLNTQSFDAYDTPTTSSNIKQGHAQVSLCYFARLGYVSASCSCKKVTLFCLLPIPSFLLSMARVICSLCTFAVAFATFISLFFPIRFSYLVYQYITSLTWATFFALYLSFFIHSCIMDSSKNAFHVIYILHTSAIFAYKNKSYVAGAWFCVTGIEFRHWFQRLMCTGRNYVGETLEVLRWKFPNHQVS